MTHQQLTDFFAYTGIPYNPDPDTIRMLRKQLLLELKSSGADVLLIAGKSYTHNDFIELFGKKDLTVEDAWSPERFLSQFPVYRKVLDPAQITMPLELPDAARWHPDYKRFLESEVWPTHETYLRELQANLKANHLKAAAGLILFHEFFDTGQQYTTESKVKLILRNKFELIKKSLQRTSGKPIPEESYFMNPFFYDILRTVAADDEDFLIGQLKTAERKIAKERNRDVSNTIYSYQRKLPFSEEILAHIQENLDRFSQAYSREAATTSSASEGPGTFRIVWIVLVIIILLVRVAMMVSR